MGDGTLVRKNESTKTYSIRKGMGVEAVEFDASQVVLVSEELLGAIPLQTYGWVDVNADGKADYCRLVGTQNFVDSRIACTLSTGTGFGSTFTSAVLDWGYAEGRAWVDVNDDDKADYCRLVGNAGQYSLLCTLSTGTGFSGQLMSSIIDPGYDSGRAWVDVSADGKADYCRLVGGQNMVSSYVQCTPSTGIGFGNTFTSALLDWGQDSGRAWVDVNNDRKADFCRVVKNAGQSFVQCTLSTGTGFSGSMMSPAIDPGYDTGRTWADVSADGQADYCRFVGGQNMVNSYVQCTLSTGTGFGSTFTSDVLDWGYDSGRAWVDVNEDAKADFCRVVGNAPLGAVQCTLSTGTTFSGSLTSSSLDWGYFEGRTWADINNDRKADYCRMVGNPGAYKMSCALSTGTGFAGELSTNL